MNVLTFKILINNQFQTLSPIYNDFKLSKIRDQQQIFVFRTVSDSEIILNGDNFDMLKDYAGQTLVGELIESISEEPFIYNILYNLENQINYDYKIWF